jgi:hypothetical protein
LAHLEVLMALEEDLGSTGHTAADIAARSPNTPTPRSVQNAMRVLKRKGLVGFEEDRKPLRFASTGLASLLLKII